MSPEFCHKDHTEITPDIIASIWCRNMLEYLSADIVYSEKQTVFQAHHITSPHLSSLHFVAHKAASVVQGKLLALRNRYCQREDIQAYFCAIWRLLWLLSFKCFLQHAGFWKLGSITRIFPSFSWEYSVLSCIETNITWAKMFDGL